MYRPRMLNLPPHSMMTRVGRQLLPASERRTVTSFTRSGLRVCTAVLPVRRAHQTGECSISHDDQGTGESETPALQTLQAGSVHDPFCDWRVLCRIDPGRQE